MQKIVVAVAVVTVGLVQTASAQEAAYQPKRINRAIELLEQGQPIYYTGSHEGTAGSFEQGKKDAQTKADYISYDMEHAPFDVKGLAEYMRGLVAGGPTKSGHRTPPVIVNVAVNGTDETTVRANAWMFQQVLATGVHGILLCHADTPGAVRAFIEAARLPIHKQGVDKGLKEGRRGVHGSTTAAKIWGIPTEEYNRKADVWPLNPNGELMLGVKLEDKYALANAEEILKIPGISFGEGGAGDMSFSLNAKSTDRVLIEAEDKLFALAKAHRIPWIGIGRNNVIERIQEGYLIGADPVAAEIGRKHTKRAMPW